MTKPKTKPVDGDDEEVDAATLIALSFNAIHGDSKARDDLRETLDALHAKRTGNKAREDME